MQDATLKYYSGTSGLILPVKNKLAYPDEFKEKSRLCFYGSLMNSIEINSSFYKAPMGSTVQKWAEDTPDDFKFSFKLWKEITHNKMLAYDPASIQRFIEVINRVQQKKGALLIQFPPSIKIDQIRQLGRLLEAVRHADPERQWQTAVEFRHPSLYHDDVYELLERNEMALVLHDRPPAITPFRLINVDFAYLRFHGPDGSYRGTYTDEVLLEYAEYIQEWLADGKAVYSYFNNTMGAAIGNLNTLRDQINLPE
ncbi:MAG: DUF72 domain-containing protein [Pedobacter sp.]|nr:MAG: DUF72 domain-containing protein [Pedobacter sp.]